jgi:uncharacterized protein (TIGR02118 family)
MHFLTFAYPTAPDEEFNMVHYLETHLPLGAGLVKKFLSMNVRKMILQKIKAPGEGGADQPYYMLCHIPFESQAELDEFVTLFNFPEAVERLSDDWPKYTPVSPQTLISEVTTLENMDEMRAHFDTVLESEYAGAAR